MIARRGEARRHQRVAEANGVGTAARSVGGSHSVRTPAPAGSYPLVPMRDTKSTSAHRPCHPQVLLKALRRRSSSGSAHHRKTSPAAQRTGGHRRVAARKTTGGYPATKGTDPMTELNGQWCCATATSGLHPSRCTADQTPGPRPVTPSSEGRPLLAVSASSWTSAGVSTHVLWIVYVVACHCGVQRTGAVCRASVLLSRVLVEAGVAPAVHLYVGLLR